MRKFRVLAMVAALFSLLLVAPVAEAQMRPSYFPSYVTLSGGGFLPDEEGLKDGWAGLMTFGYMATPFVGVQTDIGYMESSGNYVDFSAFPLALSVKVGIPIAFFEPYFLGGAGAYFTSTEVDAGPVTMKDNSTEFGPHVAAGINFNFGPLQFGFESRYLWLSASDVSLDGLMLLGKIGARF